MSAFDPLRTYGANAIHCLMFGLLYVLILVAMAWGLWWFTDSELVFAAALVAIQLFIWWVTNDWDNGVPWNLNRPLLNGPEEPLWDKGLTLLLLYGPLAGAGWALWKSRR